MSPPTASGPHPRALAARDEHLFRLSILTIGEYDKAIASLPPDHPDLPRHIASREGLAARFDGRILPVGNAVVRRWGAISGPHSAASRASSSSFM